MRLRTNPFTMLAALVWALISSLGAGATDLRPTSETDDRIQLATLVRQTIERNPEVQAARRAIDAKRARIPQAGAWPDPKVSVSYGGNVVPPFTLMRGDPSSARQVMAEQQIPYPGKTRLRAEIATRDAEAEALAYEAVCRRVAREVKEAYFDLYFTDQSLSILRQNRNVLAAFEEAAEIRYSVGKAAQQDVLKAQVEISKLGERQTLLEQTRKTLEAQLNSLRNLPVDAPVGSPAEVQPTALPYSLPELLEAAPKNFPGLKRQRTMIEGNRLAVDLAQRELRPDFSVGYVYMQRDAQPDMYGITLSTTLPIFRRKKQDQAVAEAAASLESARRMEENELAVLRYRVKQEYLQVQTASDLLTLYSKGIVPQSSLAMESSVASYQAGSIDFLSILSNFTTVLDYNLAYQEQLAGHEKALARLEELTALELLH